MEKPGKDWELDELETIKSVLRLYQAQLERLEGDDHRRYVSREEYVRVTKSLVHCLESSVRQSERIIGCIDRIIDSLSRLTDEVLDLQNRIDAQGPEEF